MKTVEVHLPKRAIGRSSAPAIREAFGRLVSRDALTLLTGSAAVQIISLVMLPILTRIYEPASFGLFATVTAICGLAIPLLALRYELAIPLPKSGRAASNLLLACLAAVVVTGIVFGSLLWALRGILSRALNSPGLASVLILVPFLLVAVGILNVLTQWSVRLQAYTLLRRSRIQQSLGQSIGQLALGLSGMGTAGLVLGQIAGQVAALVPLLRPAHRVIAAGWRTCSIGGVRRAGCRYRQFLLMSNVSVLLNVAALHSPVLVLSAFYGASVVGELALCNLALLAPWSLLGNSFSQLYVAQASQALRNRQPLLPLFAQTARKLAFLGLLPFLGIGAVSTWLLPAVLGGKWQSAGAYVVILIPMYFLQLVVSPLSNTLNLLERQDFQLAWDAARLASVLTVLVAACESGCRPGATLALYSGAMTLAYFIQLLLCRHAIRQHDAIRQLAAGLGRRRAQRT